MDTDQKLVVLEVRKTVPASKERVYQALTEPEQMNQWMYGMAEGRAEVENDLKPGGAYTITMIKPDGEEIYQPNGNYLEIDPPNKISMTWSSEGFIDHSVVSFELVAVESGTEIIIRHELPEFTVADHREGWTTCLDHCVNYFSCSV